MCICESIGKDGTSNHVGQIFIIKWIKNPPIGYVDWIGDEFEACENHIENYLRTGFFAKI